MIILTDLILLPVLVSFVPITGRFRDRVERRQKALQGVWAGLARITHRGPAAVIIAIALVLGVLGAIKGLETPIGDTQAGVPELARVALQRAAPISSGSRSAPTLST